jgi:hypothetical protein
MTIIYEGPDEVEQIRPVEIPANSLAYLQMIYKDPSLSAHVRMRAAISALPFEVPRLSVSLAMGETDYADRLEKATKFERQYLGGLTTRFKRPVRL